MANQLDRYLETNHHLSPFQGTGKSTEQIVLYAVDTIVNALNCAEIVYVLVRDRYILKVIECYHWW